MNLDAAREILLDHAKNPRNKLANESYKNFGECRNPLCGDHVQVYVQFEGEHISDVKLRVKGCTMCTASASVMSDAIKNKTKADVDVLRTSFEEVLMSPSGSAWPPELVAFEAFHHLRLNPARIPCALIGWYALKKATESK